MFKKLLVCLCLVGASAAVAQQPEMGQPEQMKIFEAMSGEFAVEMKFKMDPSMDWQTSTGTSTHTMILNGCTQMQELSSTMMGMPFKGIGMTTYKRATGKYQTSWTDSFGQGMSMYEGTMVDGKIVMTGIDNMGGMEMHVRMTSYDMSADGFKWSMEVSQDGQNYMEMMQAIYTRSSGGKEDSGGW